MSARSAGVWTLNKDFGLTLLTGSTRGSYFRQRDLCFSADVPLFAFGIKILKCASIVYNTSSVVLQTLLTCAMEINEYAPRIFVPRIGSRWSVESACGREESFRYMVCQLTLAVIYEHGITWYIVVRKMAENYIKPLKIYRRSIGDCGLRPQVVGQPYIASDIEVGAACHLPFSLCEREGS